MKNKKFYVSELPLTFDTGDINNYLLPFFPAEIKAEEGFNGDIMEINWK